MKVFIAFLFSILCSNFAFSQSSVEYSIAQAAFEKGNYDKEEVKRKKEEVKRKK